MTPKTKKSLSLHNYYFNQIHNVNTDNHPLIYDWNYAKLTNKGEKLFRYFYNSEYLQVNKLYFLEDNEREINNYFLNCLYWIDQTPKIPNPIIKVEEYKSVLHILLRDQYVFFLKENYEYCINTIGDEIKRLNLNIDIKNKEPEKIIITDSFGNQEYQGWKLENILKNLKIINNSYNFNKYKKFRSIISLSKTHTL